MIKTSFANENCFFDDRVAANDNITNAAVAANSPTIGTACFLNCCTALDDNIGRLVCCGSSNPCHTSNRRNISRCCHMNIFILLGFALSANCNTGFLTIAATAYRCAHPTTRSLYRCMIINPNVRSRTGSTATDGCAITMIARFSCHIGISLNDNVICTAKIATTNAGASITFCATVFTTRRINSCITFYGYILRISRAIQASCVISTNACRADSANNGQGARFIVCGF